MGRILGVEIRLHLFFALLLGLSWLYAGMGGMSPARGIGLWLLLLVIVGARELARAIVSVYYGLEMRSLMLLPIGGLPSYATPESTEQATEGKPQAALAIAGPATNLLIAGMLLAFILGIAPGISVMAQPWVSARHLLRSAFWLNVFLAAIHLLPAYPL
ncbi:MAG: peptidase M50, partial [Acidobacteriaceae bacterium]